MFKYGVFSGPYFFHVLTEYGKIRTIKTPYLDLVLVSSEDMELLEKNNDCTDVKGQ